MGTETNDKSEKVTGRRPTTRTEPRFTVITKSIDMSLRMLESKKAREILLNIGDGVLNNSKANRNVSTETLTKLLDQFFEAMRADFPRIDVVYLSNGACAVTWPKFWNGDWDKVNMKDVATVCIHRWVRVHFSLLIYSSILDSFVR
jgi:hypothetical protein